MKTCLCCGGENRSVFKLDGLGSEVLRIAVPASLALAADPLASLVDTAFIGRLGKPSAEPDETTLPHAYGLKIDSS
jgi:hypothetical protein